MHYDLASWRRDYQKCWRELRPVLKRIIQRFALPAAVYQRLSDSIMTATQGVAGYLSFLERAQVAAVLTEYDRNCVWASLILSAKALGIPTYTLMHGVIGEECVGYYPLLADTVFCWGQLDRDKFLAAGLDPARAVIAGCPRLTRELKASPAEVRTRLGLDPVKPLVMLGTDALPLNHRFQLVETFCKAVQRQTAFSAVVRTHPVETFAVYRNLVARYPAVTFLPNSACTLDEALAAADIVVVHNSGLGSDSLLKRRLTVVLDAIDLPLGHGRDLIELAGCPRATSSDALREIVLGLLRDGAKRRDQEQLRENSVTKLCAFFGEEAAAQIANHVCRQLAESGAAALSG